MLDKTSMDIPDGQKGEQMGPWANYAWHIAEGKMTTPKLSY